MRSRIGRIKRMLADRGFGFITPEVGPDLFFHARETVCHFEQLAEGVEVAFEIATGEKGDRAINVRYVPTRGAA